MRSRGCGTGAPQEGPRILTLAAGGGLPRAHASCAPATKAPCSPGGFSPWRRPPGSAKELGQWGGSGSSLPCTAQWFTCQFCDSGNILDPGAPRGDPSAPGPRALAVSEQHLGDFPEKWAFAFTEGPHTAPGWLFHPCHQHLGKWLRLTSHSDTQDTLTLGDFRNFFCKRANGRKDLI